jgi:flagellar hook assembly protein FlgD
MDIFDLNGRLVKTVADKFFESGEHQIQWNAEDVNDGIYFLKIESDEISKLEKLILTK